MTNPKQYGNPVIRVRAKPELIEKFYRLGGPKWLRHVIEKAPEVKEKK